MNRLLVTPSQDCSGFVAFRQEGWQRRICTRSEHVLMAVLFQETVHEWEEMRRVAEEGIASGGWKIMKRIIDGK